MYNDIINLCSYNIHEAVLVVIQFEIYMLTCMSLIQRLYLYLLYPAIILYMWFICMQISAPHTYKNHVIFYMFIHLFGIIFKFNFHHHHHMLFSTLNFSSVMWIFVWYTKRVWKACWVVHIKHICVFVHFSINIAWWNRNKL